jgi:hypothetical protein
MSGMIKAELIKQFRRKDILILSIMCILPIFYGIGAATHSSVIYYEGSQKSTFFDFWAQMANFTHMLIVFYFASAMSAVHSLRGEAENRSLQLYTQRLVDRKRLYWAKVLVSEFLVTVVYVLLGLICLASYYLFVIKRTDIATTQVFSIDTLMPDVALLLAIFFMYMTMVSIAYVLSIFFKSAIALGMTAGAFVLFSYIAQFPYLKYLSPVYYISKLANAVFKWKFLLMSEVGICLAVIGITMVIGLKAIQRMEL